MAFAQSARPIPGAVATLGVSDRVAFLRKTYAHLGGALIAFAALTGFLLRYMSGFSWGFSKWALTAGNGWGWLAVLALFMAVGWVAQRLALAERSRNLQYAGLGLAVFAEAMLLQPLLWVVMLKFGDHATQAMLINSLRHGGSIDGAVMSGLAGKVILEAVVITLVIFIGLTITVFLTKKDFSFMRGILTICSFAALGVIIASIAFGFQLGAIFCGLMVLLMAGYVLYQTSLIMSYFPPTHHVAAALMLFSTIATLFWYVLQLVMSLNDRR
jgi:FtsH-binding integral membrane protein